MAICETCDYANRPPYKSPCSECDKTMGSPFCCYEHEEKPTNADRIRSMTDEELAKVFSANCTYRDFCHGCVAEKDMPSCPGESAQKWTEWLKQPVEGD